MSRRVWSPFLTTTTSRPLKPRKASRKCETKHSTLAECSRITVSRSSRLKTATSTSQQRLRTWPINTNNSAAGPKARHFSPKPLASVSELNSFRS